MDSINKVTFRREIVLVGISDRMFIIVSRYTYQQKRVGRQPFIFHKFFKNPVNSKEYLVCRDLPLLGTPQIEVMWRIHKDKFPLPHKINLIKFQAKYTIFGQEVL